MVSYFFDTYAVIELLERNPSYLKYGQEALITSVLNKIELCWWAHARDDPKLGQLLLDAIDPIDIPDDVITRAVQFRLQHKKRNLSYADAIGYALARHHGLRFLTGDNQFKGIPDVEFVK